jgi:hypothetical protein
MSWNPSPSRVLETSLASYRTAEPTRHGPVVKMTLPILMRRENGSGSSISPPYRRRLPRQNFLGLVGLVARKSTSKLNSVIIINTCAKTLWRTSSKATTVWELYALYPHVPKVLHQGLRDSRYYVHSSDSIKMQCDSSRSQSDNRAENHQKLFDEITRIYKQRVPGITPPEQMKKIEQL